MPEGDTIRRTADALDRWLAGRAITAASSNVARMAAGGLVGDTVASVDARGKHVLMYFGSQRVVHTHQGMHGAWYLHRAGDRWSRPAGRAKLVLESNERVAVCFGAPTVELLSAAELRHHPVLAGLGPDLLDPALDLGEIVRRLRRLPPATPIGEVLLDQRVLAGIGNVYRSEVLWDHRIHPLTPVADVEVPQLEGLLRRAAALLRHNAGPGGSAGRDFGLSGPRVYRRTGRPCPRCGQLIASGLVGRPARRVYWCPGCQPARLGIEAGGV
jgi:endonuclease-8